MFKLPVFFSINLLWSLSSECFISPKVLIMNSEELSEELENERLPNNFDDLGQPPRETYWVEDPLWGAGAEVLETVSPADIESSENNPDARMTLRRVILSRLNLHNAIVNRLFGDNIPMLRSQMEEE